MQRLFRIFGVISFLFSAYMLLALLGAMQTMNIALELISYVMLLFFSVALGFLSIYAAELLERLAVVEKKLNVEKRTDDKEVV